MTKNINIKKSMILLAIAVTSILMYTFIAVNMNHFDYAMSVRVPKVIVIIITAFCIGSASIVFQSLINNTIVTPCLLGMNSLYILIHTTAVFVFGSMSIFVTNKIFSFSVDMAVMGFVAFIIYGFLFKKAQGNVLYIILAGSVMATLFTSITTTMQRMIDPNEFLTLQNSLIASFNKVNSDIIFLSLIFIFIIILVLRKDIKLLNVITLGKDQAINLGVDYDKSVRRLLLGVTLLIAIATALVGPISFLGLIVANLSRQIFKTYKHSYLICGTILVAIITLFAGQILVERVFSFSANISAFINMGGGAYFLYLLLKSRR